MLAMFDGPTGVLINFMPRPLYPVIEHLYQLSRRMVGPQSLSGCFREEIKAWP